MKKWALLAALLLTLLAITAGASPEGMMASPPATISSVIVPPSSERAIFFSDRGRSYLVGLSSGRVTVVDGSAPAPGPVIPPYTPPAPSLTGLSKSVYDGLTAAPIDAQNRVLGAKALISAIDSTISEVGGLNIQDPQQIVNKLAENAEANQVNRLLAGWKLGDLLSNSNLTTKEQLLQALADIRKGLEAIR